MLQRTEAEAGAKVVLNFWPNSRLAVLIKVVLIKKKRVGGFGFVYVGLNRTSNYKKLITRIFLFIQYFGPNS